MAEQTTEPVATPAAKEEPAKDPKSTQNYDEIFAKLDKILEQRTDGLGKSALKVNGIDDAESKEILAAYREHKTAKATEQDSALQTAKSRAKALEKELTDARISTAIKDAAAEVGIDRKTAAYIVRLIDRDGLADTDGKVAEDKVVEAVKKVLEDIPSLKTDKGGAGFVPVGAKTPDASTPQGEEDAKLRRAFGLK